MEVIGSYYPVNHQESQKAEVDGLSPGLKKDLMKRRWIKGGDNLKNV